MVFDTPDRRSSDPTSRSKNLWSCVLPTRQLNVNVNVPVFTPTASHFPKIMAADTDVAWRDSSNTAFFTWVQFTAGAAHHPQRVPLEGTHQLDPRI